MRLNITGQDSCCTQKPKVCVCTDDPFVRNWRSLDLWAVKQRHKHHIECFLAAREHHSSQEITRSTPECPVRSHPWGSGWAALLHFPHELLLFFYSFWWVFNDDSSQFQCDLGHFYWWSESHFCISSSRWPWRSFCPESLEENSNGRPGSGHTVYHASGLSFLWLYFYELYVPR